MTADPAATAVDGADRVIPAQRIDIPLSVTDTFPATGVRVVQQKATGTVTFQNCDTGRAHVVAAGSVVSTDAGIGFATSDRVALDRAQLVGIPPFQSVQCSTVSTGVTAAKAGTSGNVAAGAIDQMPPGYDTTVLHVANSDPTAGGTRQEIPRVQKKDVDGAVTALQKRIDEQMTSKLEDPGLVPEGTTLFPDTATTSDPQPTSNPDDLVNQEVDSFQLTMTATGQVTAADEAPLQQLAADRLGRSVAADHDLVADSANVQIGAPSADGPRVTFPISVTANEVLRVDPAVVRREAKGKSLASARAALARYGQVSVSVWPDWVSSITSIDARLDVRVVPSVAVASPGPSASGSRAGSGGSIGPASNAPASSPGSSATDSAAP